MLLYINCKKTAEPVNNAPVILSLTPSKKNVNFLESITIKADVKDADGDSIIFLWISDKGNFTFTSLDSAVWNAPDSSGRARIALRVNDIFDAFNYDSTVITVQNQIPVISLITATQTNVLVGNIITITATASDPDGGQLMYNWEAAGGEFIGSVTGNEVTWKASTTVSNVSIKVTVTDDNNDFTTSEIVINVFQELGSIWISDTFNDQVVKFASNGTQLLRKSGFNRPQGLALNIADRTLWIADWGGNRVVKLSSGGEELFEVTGLDRPTDIALRANGNAWVTTMGDSNQVVEISHNGTILNKLSGFSDPQSIDVYQLNGDIWIADTGNDRIILLEPQVPNGYNLDLIAGMPVRYDTQFGNYSNPEALEVNQQTGNCWIADTGNHRVVRINKSGSFPFEFVIGGLLNPRGLAVNKLDGSCWVTNTGENEVIKIFSDIFTLPVKEGESYNIDIDAGFHFVIPGYTQPWAVDINVIDGIVWFAENFRLVKVQDLGTNYSIIGGFTNFNAPKSLVINPGSILFK
ncbi:hypothetical protein AMJ80_08800 [bacterium SM23_31]|nr:MAG: hypothetical protein AMJ80_08800 [bacterium SM23_31]